jgi:hypothetical protein
VSMAVYWKMQLIKLSGGVSEHCWWFRLPAAVRHMIACSAVDAYRRVHRIYCIEVTVP